MIFNQAGLDLIKQFEGCSLVAYQDQGGVWSIGYGHTLGVKHGQTCTPEEALQYLDSDIAEISKQVTALLTNDQLNSNQFSALVCFAYNLGSGNLAKSTLLNCINTYHVDEAANEFERWVKVDGIPNEGLLRRRQAEKTLFLTPA